MLTVQTATLLSAAIVNTFLLVVVASDGWRKNKLFISLASAVILWIVGTLLFLIAPSELIASLGIQLFYIAPMYAILFLALFATHFSAQSNTRLFDIYNISLAVFTVLFSGLLAILPAFLTASISISGGYNILEVNKDSYLLYTLFFNVAFTLTFVRLFFRVKRTKGAQKKQFLYILVGTGLTAAISLVTNLTLPSLGNSLYIWIGPSASIFYVVAIAAAIIRHSLFDIRLAAVRTAAYALSLSTLAVIYYTAVYVVSLILFQGQASLSVSISPLNILLALVLAFIFQPIRQFFDRATDKIFFHDRYKPDDFYVRLSEVLTTTTELRTLLRRAAEEVASTLKAQQVFFYIKHGEAHHLAVGASHHTTLPAGDVKVLDDYTQEYSNEVIVTDMLDSKQRVIRKLLVSHKIEILMPLLRDRVIVGYVALGPRQGGGYVKRDVKVLETVSDELVIAIQNALSVQEVKELNAHLQQRISAATSELRRTNARLRRLDTTKDEFLSMASHQLRTPLTSIKGYLSMVLDGDLGRVSATQKKVLEEAFTSSERMVHLIHDFLNVSRLQTGRFVLELGENDLSSLVKGEVDSLRRVAESRNMTIEYKDEAGSIPLLLDDTKLRQVVMNYIDNAIYYSKPDTAITVELLKQDGNIVLKVHDTGIGVPLSEQAQLFEKFFRATNARKQRPDGTGVGLYLAKKVITAHGGDVLFSSRPGKGSMFGFKLPLTQDKALLEKNSTKQF